MVMKKCCGVHALRIAVGITMVVLLLMGGVGAATITVNASGGGDYTRIQKAIDNAIAGDTILVYSGNYHENVNITKQLTLRGIGNPVVDAGGRGSAITLSANGITIEGFTATGSSGWKEAGINITSSNNTLIGNNASNNRNSAIGISLSDSSNNTLSGNNALNNDGYYGAGISLSNSSNNTLTGNNASNNDVGGISLSDSSNNMLTGNNASNNRIGISLWYSSNNNTMSDNNALNNGNGINYGFGISLYSSSNNTLTRNNASKNRIGIILESSSNNKIYNNIFNNTKNFKFQEKKINRWNTKKQSGTNIIGGSILGGNFWANPDGTGFSQTCPDVNGDGICDKSYGLDANNIDYMPLSMNFTKDKIPPKSVTKLKNISYASSYINWTWKDPKDIDFKKVMVFIDGNFKKNVSKGKRYYNATNFKSNTRYTISTRTVDMNGNINKTWKNSSAWTAK